MTGATGPEGPGPAGSSGPTGQGWGAAPGRTGPGWGASPGPAGPAEPAAGTPVPAAPPVRLATALAVLTTGLLLFQVIGLIARFVPWQGVGGGADIDLDQARGIVIVLTVVLVLVVLVLLALSLTSIVLSILVAVKGRGLLRRGAVVLLVPIVLGMMFSLDVTGDLDALPAWVGTALDVAGLLGDLLELALTAAGLWFLVAGLRQLRRPPAPSSAPVV